MKQTTISKLIIFTSVIIILFGNFAFFKNVLVVYPLNVKNSLFLLSLVVVFGSVTVFLLSLVCFKYTVKPVLISVLLLSAATAYFMDTYNVIIDDVMINNILSTDAAEIGDLFSLGQFLYILLLGILPSLYIYKAEIIYPSYKKSVLSRAKLTGFSAVVVIVTILLLSNFYASFFREHKPLRYYANPTYTIYSAVKYAASFFEATVLPFKTIATDAKVHATDVDRELIVLVVGETARADHFSLNGYSKQTNPYLANEDVISFSNVWACGTSTAVSVPCMFSIYGRGDYDRAEAGSTENILDILQRSGSSVLWLDNNSDSKGVAGRITYESYKSADKNPVCDEECRDVGMLAGVQPFIDAHPAGDIIIVLHQMGNHGPAYYKRYPKSFERFTPTCETNRLENCSADEINNTYDNAIAYTDYFLSETIHLLKNNDKHYETAMLYMSDHGESLGENNLYLHGLPYMIAPDVQKRVPVIMWFGENFKHEINFESLKNNINTEYSHANLFHTLLGLMEVETEIYDKKLDMIEHDEE